jgi:hypothetical protein
MLGGIAQTTGGMADAFKPVLQGATKPRGDMADPNHLQRLAEWASSNGDAQQAAMYMSEARRVRAEMKEASAKLEAETKNKAAGAATLQYKEALESKDPTKIQKAEEALIANAAALGYDALDRMNAANSAVTRAQQEADRQEDRAAAAADKKFEQQFAGTMNTANSVEEIQKAVEAAPAEMKPAAQRAANVRLQFLEARDARNAREAENQQVVDVEVSIPTDPTVLPEALQKQYSAELAQLKKDTEAGKVNGTWEPSVRRALQKRRDKLEDKVSDAVTRNVLTRESEARTEMRAFDRRWAAVSTSLPTKQQAKEIKDELEDAGTEGEGAPEGIPFFKTPGITSEQVIAEFRRRQYESLEPLRPDGSEKPESTGTRTFTDAEEARISAAMQQNPGRTREEIIAKLYPEGS